MPVGSDRFSRKLDLAGQLSLEQNSGGMCSTRSVLQIWTSPEDALSYRRVLDLGAGIFRSHCTRRSTKEACAMAIEFSTTSTTNQTWQTNRLRSDEQNVQGQLRKATKTTNAIKQQPRCEASIANCLQRRCLGLSKLPCCFVVSIQTVSIKMPCSTLAIPILALHQRRSAGKGIPSSWAHAS